MSNDMINGIEVPELTQEQVNALVENRVLGDHDPMQNGDSFSMLKYMTAIAAYMNKHRPREAPGLNIKQGS